MENVQRTFEPFKFLGRFFWTPLRIRRGSPIVSYAPTWESEAPYRFGPTLVVRAWPLPAGVGVGVWLDTDVEDLTEERELRRQVEEEDAEYHRYVAINGPVDRNLWGKARKQVAALGLDPDGEMAMLQQLGIME